MARRSSRFWSTLFAIGLAISLCLGQVSTVKAQVPQGNLLVEQGVTEYQQGKYQAAIALWQRALSDYQATADNPNTVVVLENLARVYQQIGQPEQAISFWSQVTDSYQQQGNEQQLGRSLSELAQAYSSLGQHRQAIALALAEGLSIRTIAKVTGLSSSRVHQLLHTDEADQVPDWLNDLIQHL